MQVNKIMGIVFTIAPQLSGLPPGSRRPSLVFLHYFGLSRVLQSTFFECEHFSLNGAIKTVNSACYSKCPDFYPGQIFFEISSETGFPGEIIL